MTAYFIIFAMKSAAKTATPASETKSHFDSHLSSSLIDIKNLDPLSYTITFLLDKVKTVPHMILPKKIKKLRKKQLTNEKDGCKIYGVKGKGVFRVFA